MEIIVVLVVLAVLGYWAWSANNAKKDQSSDKHPLDIVNDNAVEKQAPYKVEPPKVDVNLVLGVPEIKTVIPESATETSKPEAKKAPAKKAAPAKKTAAKKAAPAKKTGVKKKAV